MSNLQKALSVLGVSLLAIIFGAILMVVIVSGDLTRDVKNVISEQNRITDEVRILKETSENLGDRVGNLETPVNTDFYDKAQIVKRGETVFFEGVEYQLLDMHKIEDSFARFILLDIKNGNAIRVVGVDSIISVQTSAESPAEGVRLIDLVNHYKMNFSTKQ